MPTIGKERAARRGLVPGEDLASARPRRRFCGCEEAGFFMIPSGGDRAGSAAAGPSPNCIIRELSRTPFTRSEDRAQSAVTHHQDARWFCSIGRDFAMEYNLTMDSRVRRPSGRDSIKWRWNSSPAMSPTLRSGEPLRVTLNSQTDLVPEATEHEQEFTEKGLGTWGRKVWIHPRCEHRCCVCSDAILCAPPACLGDLCVKLRFWDYSNQPFPCPRQRGGRENRGCPRRSRVWRARHALFRAGRIPGPIHARIGFHPIA